MKKHIALLFISLITIACSKDNADDIDPSMLLTSFTEPYIEFGIDQAELEAQLGAPDASRGFSGGKILSYGMSIDGIVSYEYLLLPTSNFGDEIGLAQINVNLDVNRPNFNFIRGWLENRYGVSTFFEGFDSDTNTYTWNPSGYSLNLNFSANLSRDDSLLFLAYKPTE